MYPRWTATRWWAAQRAVRLISSFPPPADRNCTWCACTAARLRRGSGTAPGHARSPSPGGSEAVRRPAPPLRWRGAARSRSATSSRSSASSRTGSCEARSAMRRRGTSPRPTAEVGRGFIPRRRRASQARCWTVLVAMPSRSAQYWSKVANFMSRQRPSICSSMARWPITSSQPSRSPTSPRSSASSRAGSCSATHSGAATGSTRASSSRKAQRRVSSSSACFGASSQLAPCDSQDGLRLARAHLALAHGLGQDRPVAQLARQPRQLLRHPTGHAQPLAAVVADAGEAEPEHAVADGERREPLTDRDVERATAARHAREQPVEQDGRLVAEHALALVRPGRSEGECPRLHGFERGPGEGRASGGQAGWRLLHEREITRTVWLNKCPDGCQRAPLVHSAPCLPAAGHLDTRNAKFS